MRRASVVVLLFLLIIVGFKGQYFSMLMGKGDFWDFDVYTQTVRDVTQGVSPYEVSYMQTLGPPLVLVPYALFAFFPVQISHIFFTVSSLAALILSCWLLAEKYSKGSVATYTLFLLLILLSAFPTRFTFITGQLNAWLVLCVVGVLVSTSEKVKGIAIGSMSVLKTFFIFSLIGAWRRWKIVSMAMGVCFVSIITSMLLVTPSAYLQYRNRFSSVMWQPDRITTVAYYNQSFKITLSRLGLVNQSVAIWVIVSIFVAFYLFISRNFLAGIVFSIMFSPVAWQHYFIALFPLFVYAFTVVRHKPRWLVLWVAAVSLWWVEFPWLHNQSLTLWTGLLASHYSVSALLLAGVLVYNHHQT